MAKPPSWETVARALGEQMEAHAFCNEHRKITEGCPACDDLAAYQMYRAKLTSIGVVEHDPFKNTVNVSVFDLARSAPKEPLDG